MEISSAELDADAAYKLLVGIVVPRPIAWITTLSPGGLVNAAPFSCYTFVCNDPPMVGVNIGRRAGALKDTARNMHDTGEFVINVVTEDLAGPMHASSAECETSISEVAALGLATRPSTEIRVPRLACSPINLECRLEREIELGRHHNLLVIGRIVRFHIADEIYGNGRIRIDKFKPLARLGGPNYAPLGPIMTLPTAQLPEKQSA